MPNLDQSIAWLEEASHWQNRQSQLIFAGESALAESLSHGIAQNVNLALQELRRIRDQGGVDREQS